jgi:hypothetical protein
MLFGLRRQLKEIFNWPAFVACAVLIAPHTAIGAENV